jgi:uncharacterized tellurite resistance protein B-like protein
MTKVSKWFERFRKDVITCARKDGACKYSLKKPRIIKVDTQIGLGVLLWGMGAIAEADGKLLPEEDKKIEDIVLVQLKIAKSDLPVVSTAIKQAAIGNINFYRIAREVNKTLSGKAKASLIENLLRVAYADKNLDDKEFKIIKRVSDLFHIAQKDLFNIELKIKKELGMEPVL